MIIKKIKLHNFGVYYGDNEFSFTGHKPIVLIGGMNGHGKTTFLEAILLALYGSNSPAYNEKKRISYNTYLKNHINRLSVDKEAMIELEFELAVDDRYLIKREWILHSRKVEESLYIEHNGKFDEFLTKNWIMFVEKILPHALSKFFFFDGEKIAEMAIETNDSQVKESIKAMLGINTLDVLENDLKKIFKKCNSKIDQNTTIENILEQQVQNEKLNSEIISDQEKLNQIEESCHDVEKRISQLQNQYGILGGKAIEQRQKLSEDKATLSLQLESINDQLIEISASTLPLKMVWGLLGEIKSSSVDERYNRIMAETIAICRDRLIDYNLQTNKENEEVKGFLDFINADIEDDSVVYDLSDQAIRQIEELIEFQLDNEMKNAKKLIADKKEKISQIDKISSYLLIDINDKELTHVLSEIKDEQDNLLKLKEKKARLEESIKEKNNVLFRQINELQKVTENYLNNAEISDDNSRKLKYISMSLQVLAKYKIRLQKEKIRILAKEITSCYKKLSNKKNLINLITLDEETLDFVYLSDSGDYIEKDSLSAGEKQLVVISTLWALAICSKKKLPVIIDTPLARLDSVHRSSLVKTYFPNASEQTIILSTDSEIDDNYYQMMKEYIDDKYLLDYNDETRCTRVLKGYFNGGKDID